MAKTQKQKLYDDLNALVEKYPNMMAGDFIVTTEGFLQAMYRCLPGKSKTTKRKVLCSKRTHTYRLA